jgi:folate-binding protein YgfZ
LTQDVDRLKTGQAALAGYCTAQGRLLANMVLAPTQAPDQVLGIVQRDVLPNFLKRLRMFVLRSKVTLDSTTQQVSGIVVQTAKLASVAQALGYALPQAVWDTVNSDDGIWIAAPSADITLARFWWVTDELQRAALSTRLGADFVTHESSDAWAVQDLQAGIPWINDRTVDLFIPQTINLDLTEGVSFTKGCYPGQEVVARAHYRGTVKRRMQLAHLDGELLPIKPGEDIFCPADGPNPCGRVVNVGFDGKKIWLLFEAPMKLTQTEESGALRVSTADGPKLAIADLPYPITTER